MGSGAVSGKRSLATTRVTSEEPDGPDIDSEMILSQHIRLSSFPRAAKHIGIYNNKVIGRNAELSGEQLSVRQT